MLEYIIFVIQLIILGLLTTNLAMDIQTRRRIREINRVLREERRGSSSVSPKISDVGPNISDVITSNVDRRIRRKEQ